MLRAATGSLLAGVLVLAACDDPVTPRDSTVPTRSLRRAAVISVSDPSVIPLGPLSSDFSTAFGVNNAGVVAGQSFLADGGGTWHGFTFSESAGAADLGQWMLATAVNDRGVVAGLNDGNNRHPPGVFLWYSPTDVRVVDVSAYPFLTVRALNNGGQFVGNYQIPLSPGGLVSDRAYIGSEISGVRSIGSLGGDYTQAYAINDRGQVVGISNYLPYASHRASPYHGFIWDESGGMRPLGAFNTGVNSYSSAAAINDAGEVVGESYNDAGQRRAFRWTERDGMQDLGTLGGNAASAQGINNRGEIVGWSVTAASETTAFVWTRESGMVSLGRPVGARFSVAVDINDDGVVVGRAGIGDATQFFGQTYVATMWRVATAPPQVEQSISFTSAPPTPAYVGDQYQVGATASSGLPVRFSIETPDTCTIEGVAVSFAAEGTCVIAADQVGDASHLPAPRAMQLVLVTRRPQSIAFSPEPPVTALVGGSYTLNATGGASGNPVAFSTLSPTVCAVEGATVAFLNIGPCTVAADQAGSAAFLPAAQRTATIAVVWPFVGFLSPLANSPTLNVAKAGSAIPVKFSLRGDRGPAVLASGSPYSSASPCTTGGSESVVTEAAAAGQSGLTYDATSDTYKYAWKTDAAWAGTCRTLTLRLADGTKHEARVQFR